MHPCDVSHLNNAENQQASRMIKTSLPVLILKMAHLKNDLSAR